MINPEDLPRKDRILFLDIDGPLCSSRSVHVLGYDGRTAMGFDPVCVGLVQSMIDTYNCKLVISSTWALHGRDGIRKILMDAGLKFEFHEDWCTPRKMSSSRGNEISWWIEEHEEIDAHDMIAIDDMPLYFQDDIHPNTDEDVREHRERLKQVCVLEINSDEGITWADYIKTYTHFGIRPPMFLM